MKIKTIIFDHQNVHNEIKEILKSFKDKNYIGVFDFDGVISSKTEDLVYRLPFEEKELILLSEISKLFNHDVIHTDNNFRRHLLFQLAQFKLGRLSQEGPVFRTFQEFYVNNLPTFILTARSGYYANKRVYQFLEEKRIYPNEVFHVGRDSKCLQFETLSNDFPNHEIIYFEDSDEQIVKLQHWKSAVKNKITVIHIKYNLNYFKFNDIKEFYLNTISESLHKFQEANEKMVDH